MFRFLLYLTNNLERSMHEDLWDIGEFIVATLSIIGASVWLFWLQPDMGWGFGMILFYVQAVDQIRKRDKRNKPVKKFEAGDKLSPREEL